MSNNFKVQSVLVDRKLNLSLNEAKKRVQDAGFKVKKVDMPASGRYYRFRQLPPDKKKSYVTLKKGGVSLILFK